ncbi:hypothetical protein HPP92_028879 [Vanilla planifolia]|uniref:Uncharacterized protein n=1 Tax=Vanilla planifolia TaxID=51239 RepID=A0A835P7J0_VANPL|nr:hypothetical protein HPP92_028879 [Vanilla planifolia]KAG0446366.1 hypothetical protein HPP92_028868 [Vanilla planifolia]
MRDLIHSTDPCGSPPEYASELPEGAKLFNKNELRQTSGSLLAGHMFDGRRFADLKICQLA